MELLLRYDLPFVSVTLVYQGASRDIQNILVDTGSATTVISADIVADLGIAPEATDLLQTIQGVGGIEIVYERQIDALTIGDRTIHNFVIEVGGVDYGFDINGILGMDALKQIRAIIDLAEMKLKFSE